MFTIVHDVMTFDFVKKMNIESAYPLFDMNIKYDSTEIQLQIQCDFRSLSDGCYIENIVVKSNNIVDNSIMNQLIVAIDKVLDCTLIEECGKRIVESILKKN